MNGEQPQQRTGERFRLGKRATRIAVFGVAFLLVVGLGIANRTDIGAWFALHVVPIVSRPIDQHVGFASTSDGVRVAYATPGAGPPLVMTLGWFTHLTDGMESPRYDGAGKIREWSRDHLVVRYDGRGFGLSDRSATDFSLDSRVRDLEAVVDELGLRRFALCGYGSGGPTALTYTARHPERVSRLVLLATFMSAESDDGTWSEQAAAWMSIFERARTAWEEPATRAALVELMHPNGSEIERRVLMAQYLNSGDGPAFANFNSVSVDAAEAARRIRIPTLVVAGGDDAELPVDTVSRVADAIPGARFEVLDGVDHFETIGNHSSVIHLVSSFLAEEQTGEKM